MISGIDLEQAKYLLNLLLWRNLRKDLTAEERQLWQQVVDDLRQVLNS